jgi:hypothetical protein
MDLVGGAVYSKKLRRRICIILSAVVACSNKPMGKKLVD